MRAWLLTLAVIVSTQGCATVPEPSGQAASPAPRRVTKVVDAYPMLAPDGSRVLFQSDRTGNWELYTVKPDGTELRRLTTTRMDEASAVWSPDGSRIAFASEQDGNSDIYVMAADGSKVRRLTDHPGDDSHPHWSADGSRIIFCSPRTTPDPKAPWARQWHEAFSIQPDGAGLRQHTRCQAACTYPSFSPDGKKIAYRKLMAAPGLQWDLTSMPLNSEVFVADADGSNEVNVSRSPAFDGWPMWSPDGALIVFSSNRQGPAMIGQLFVVKPDGSELRQITSGPLSYVQPSWSADGKRIHASLYSADEETASIVEVPAP